MTERKIPIQATFSKEQVQIFDKIANAKGNRPSNAQILKDAFDFYVAMKFPQFLK